MKLWEFIPGKRPQVPIVADIPHSGTYIPNAIRGQFKRDPAPVLTNQDWHLDKLYDFLPELGISVLRATHSRYVVDLNREVKTPVFGPAATSVVSQTNTQGSILYDSNPSTEEVETRVAQYYRPYHKRLNDILHKIVQNSGYVILLDLHSYFLPPRHHICLGNRNGVTCTEKLIRSFEEAFRGQGFEVGRNDVLNGGFITKYYDSLPHVESLQIELRFPVYLEGEDFGEVEITDWDSLKFRDARERLRMAFLLAIQMYSQSRSDMEQTREGVELRRYRPSDKDSVWQLHVQGLEQYSVRLDARFRPGLDDDLTRIEDEYLKNGDFLVATIGNDIVGIGALRKENSTTAEIKRMRVKVDFQGKGIGTMILDNLIDKARNLGYKRIILDTTQNMTVAQRLYQSRGFIEYKRAKIADFDCIYYKLDFLPTSHYEDS